MLTYPTIWIITAAIAGLLLGALVAWLWVSRRTRQQVDSLRLQLIEAQTRATAAEEKRQWLEAAQQQMRDSFQSVASDVLKTNSDELVKRSQEQTSALLAQVAGDWQTQKAEFQGLVDPLKESLGSLDQQVQALEQKREGAYEGLQEQLRHLSQTQSDLQRTAITLSQALRSPTVRGQWGELQLLRVVEMAGMTSHVSFETQFSTDGGRPDMVISLPHGGILPIDAKTPLVAYLEAHEAGEESVRRSKLSEHARALRGRVAELSQKKYWSQFDNAPDFVVMFVPNDACLAAAFETDPQLLEAAIGKNVLITTPVTLLALLRTVAYGWQQYQMTENSRLIAAEGRQLYSRLATFVDHLAQLHQGLNKAVDAYNKAIGSLDHRVFPSVRRLKELGVAESELAPPPEIDTHARVHGVIEA